MNLRGIVMTKENNFENEDNIKTNASQNEEKKVVIDVEKDGVVTEKTSQSSSQSSTQTENKTNAQKKRKLGTILGLDEIKNIFKRTKEQNKNVKKYAILGIIFAICSVALVYPCFYGGIGIFNYVLNGFFANFSSAMAGNIVLILLIGFIVVVFLGTIAIVLFLLPIALALFSLILPIFQLIVNRKWWGWVTLALCISAIPLCVFFMSLLIKVL